MAIVAYSADKEREGYGCPLPSNLPGHNRPKAAVGRRGIQRFELMAYFFINFIF